MPEESAVTVVRAEDSSVRQNDEQVDVPCGQHVEDTDGEVEAEECRAEWLLVAIANEKNDVEEVGWR